MSEFKREARYIVVKPDCEDSLRTERLKSYIDEMCFKTPDCVVVEADWPEYEPVWRMIESRVMGLPNELECAQSELAALREDLATQDRVLRASVPDRHKGCTSPVGAVQSYIVDLEQRLADAERRNAELIEAMERIHFRCESFSNDDRGMKIHSVRVMLDIAAKALKPTESGASE